MKKSTNTTMVNTNTGEIVSPVILTPYTYRFLKPDKEQLESNYNPSLTVPDMALTLEEILQRAARGLYMEDPRVALYEGNSAEDDDNLIRNYIPDVDSMDNIDIQRLRDQAIEQAEQARIKLAAKDKAIKRKQQEETAKRLREEAASKAEAGAKTEQEATKKA